jgi:hypothetical protein
MPNTQLRCLATKHKHRLHFIKLLDQRNGSKGLDKPKLQTDLNISFYATIKAGINMPEEEG